jgi:phosphate transport system substrate-binding protein
MTTKTRSSQLVVIAVVLTVVAVLSMASCSDDSNSSASEIHAYTRESGSGTRSAFIELFKLQDSNKNDLTTASASVTNSTAVMMTSVASDIDAIGYISLGSLSDTVKAVQIDGINPTAENVVNGSYPIWRPFNIVTKGDVNAESTDFINFILSASGQEIVSKNQYIKLANSKPFKSSNPSGKVVVAGSSSVSPLMEKLIEAYTIINPNLKIELQTSDSSTGVTDTIEGRCDIGMSSRELKESELSKGVQGQEIARDGLAVIVNNGSNVTNLTSSEVTEIYKGDKLNWN